MEITAEHLEEVLAAAKEEAKQSVVNEVKSQLEWLVKQELSTAIREIVKEYITTEIAPEVSAILVSSKGPILEALGKAAEELGSALADGLIEDAKKSVADSYNRRKLIEAVWR